MTLLIVLSSFIILWRQSMLYSWHTYSSGLTGLLILNCESVKLLCRVWLCDPLDDNPLAPLSMGFSRQEFCSGLPFPSLGDLPNPGIEPGSPALQADSFIIWATKRLFLNWVMHNLLIELSKFFICSVYKTLIRYMICKYFQSVACLTVLTVSLKEQQFSVLIEVQFIFFLFMLFVS